MVLLDLLKIHFLLRNGVITNQGNIDRANCLTSAVRLNQPRPYIETDPDMLKLQNALLSKGIWDLFKKWLVK